MDTRKRFTITGVIVAVLAIGGMAVAANLGLLGLAGADDKIGQLDAGEVRDLVDEPTTTGAPTSTTTSTSTTVPTTAAPPSVPATAPATPAPTPVPPPAPPVTFDDDGTADQGSTDVPEVGDDSGSNSGSDDSGSDDTDEVDEVDEVDEDSHEGDDDDD